MTQTLKGFDALPAPSATDVRKAELVRIAGTLLYTGLVYGRIKSLKDLNRELAQYPLGAIELIKKTNEYRVVHFLMSEAA